MLQFQRSWIKMKKIKELRKELLENYFTLDGNVATLKLIYDSFIELVNLNFGDEKVEKLNDKLFSDISEAISLLPRNYKLNLEIVIKDFGNYQKEECEKIIRNNLYLIGYQAIKRNNRKKITGYTLITINDTNKKVLKLFFKKI